MALFFLRHLLFEIKQKKTLEYRFINSSDLYDTSSEFASGTLEQKIYVETMRLHNERFGKPTEDTINYYP